MGFDFGFRGLGSGFRASSFGFRVPGFGFRVSESGFQESGSYFRVPGFVFQDSGAGFRVSRFRLRVLGSGFTSVRRRGGRLCDRGVRIRARFDHWEDPEGSCETWVEPLPVPFRLQLVSSSSSLLLWSLELSDTAIYES